MIVALGDLHLDDSRPWGMKVSQDVVDFIINHPSNIKDNDLILLGDITDKPFVHGSITTLLHTLFQGLKYKNTYICMGNHEGKVRNGEISTTYDFLEEPDFNKTLASNIQIIKNYKAINIEGLNTLFLPHIYASENASLKDYENLPEEVTKITYDLIVGHITDSRLGFPSTDKVDISKLKSKNVIMGHIHSGEYFDRGYIGSVIPNNIAESAFSRYILYIDKGVISKEALPILLEYKEVTFPEYLTRSKAKTIVWTVNNCTDEEMARSHYKNPDMFIRKCVYTSQIDKEAFKNVINSSSTIENFTFFLNDWLDIKGSAINDSLREKIRYYSTRH